MPLNSPLFNALAELAAKTNGPPPGIVNEGVGFTYSVVKTRGGRLVLLPESGEEYHINCPYCPHGDNKKRLYVHHMYGMPSPDPRIKGPMIDLAYCQHEQKKKPQLFITLKNYMWALEHGLINPEILQQAAAVEVSDPLEQEPPSMGQTVSLKEMPESEHYRYWLRRGYNPEYLSDSYHARIPLFHPDDRMWDMIRSRTLFPYLYKGRVIMWQGRLTYDHADKWPPKWWFPGGTRKVLWNIDLALQFPVCILCEGISSGIAAGPAAMGIGGKTLNTRMVEFIAENWEAAMVMLDPAAGINRKSDEQDYQRRLIGQLMEAGLSAVGARWMRGDNRDPGDLGPAGCVELIRRSDSAFAQRLVYCR